MKLLSLLRAMFPSAVRESRKECRRDDRALISSLDASIAMYERNEQQP